MLSLIASICYGAKKQNTEARTFQPKQRGEVVNQKPTHTTKQNNKKTTTEHQNHTQTNET